MKKFIVVIYCVLFSSVCSAEGLADLTIGQYLKMNTKKNEVTLKNYLSGIADGIYYSNVRLIADGNPNFVCIDRMTPAFRNGAKMLFDIALNDKKQYAKTYSDKSVSAAVMSLFTEIMPPSCENVLGKK